MWAYFCAMYDCVNCVSPNIYLYKCSQLVWVSVLWINMSCAHVNCITPQTVWHNLLIISLFMCAILVITPQMCQYCIIAWMLLQRWISFVIQIYAQGEVIPLQYYLAKNRMLVCNRYECGCVFMHVVFECIIVVLLVNFIS